MVEIGTPAQSGSGRVFRVPFGRSYLKSDKKHAVKHKHPGFHRFAQELATKAECLIVRGSIRCRGCFVKLIDDALKCWKRKCAFLLSDENKLNN